MIKVVPVTELDILPTDIDLMWAERMAENISLQDPFQLATTPLREVAPLLPPQTINTLTEEYKHMPVKIVAENVAPSRMFKKGTVSTKQDYSDVMIALRDLKAGQALVVTMDPKAWEGVKKPETTFAATLRRGFEIKNLQITAYQSAKMEITIRKASPLDPKKKKKA